MADSRTSSRPSGPASRRQWVLRGIAAGAVLLILVGGTTLALRISKARRPPVTIGQPLGVRRLPEVVEAGFHDTEGGPDKPFRWTNGVARLVVPASYPPPRALFVRLGLGIPRPTRLAIRLNGSPLFDEKVKPQEFWSRRFNLTDLKLSGPAEIELLSDPFIPRAIDPKAHDARTLGVIVREISLIYPGRDFTGVNLAGNPDPEVDESGFYHREEENGQPCRWTDGNARVVVPTPPKSRWKTLTVAGGIPEVPDPRVEIIVNGKTLCDEKAKPLTNWSKQIDLKDVDLGPEATILVRSSTMVPSKISTTNRDSRVLGLRLKKLIFD